MVLHEGRLCVDGKIEFCVSRVGFERIKKNYVKKTNDEPLGDLIAFIPAVESTPLGEVCSFSTTTTTTTTTYSLPLNLQNHRNSNGFFGLYVLQWVA